MAFRMSPEESDQLNTFVKLSGLTKQEYIIRRLLVKEVVIQGNSRVYKALREQFSEVKCQRERSEAGCSVEQEVLEHDYGRYGRGVPCLSIKEQLP